MNERQLFVWELMGKDAISYKVLHPSDLSLPALITYTAVTVTSVHKQSFTGAKSTEHMGFLKWNNNLKKIRKILLPYFRIKRRNMTNEDVQLTTSDCTNIFSS